MVKVSNNERFPADREAETWVIGSILLQPSILDDLGWLHVADFYHDDLRQLYAAMLDMRRQGQPLDPALLGKRFAGGDWAARIYEIAAAVPMPSHFRHYAAIVADLAKRRRLMEIGLTLAAAARQDDGTAEEVLERAETDLAGIRAGGDRGEPVTLAQAAIAANERIDAICRRGESFGLPTGLETFDNDMGGLFPGELTILAARPGVGKTALALQVANYNAARGRLCYLASLEMSAVELSTRLACGQSGVSNRLVRIGKLSDDDKTQLVEAFNNQAHALLEIDDRPALTVATIRREIRKRKRRGLDLAVVDYLQLITPDDHKIIREQQVARMVRGLKETAREYQVPILCLCQLNRLSDNSQVPSLGHLRESGAIEQDADVVLFLSKYESTVEPYNTILTIAKNRNGETGNLRLHWDAGRTLFSCVKKEPQHQPYDEFANYS